MDPDISRWILEFLLRQPIPDATIEKLMKSLPHSDNNVRLKKAILLRSIESQIAEASVSETILRSLEIIEEIDSSEGRQILDSMKLAYCGVAVECTVKYMVGSGDKNGKYLDSVKKIWRERLKIMEDSGKSELASDQMRMWKDRIEAAVWDSKLCDDIVKKNTRNEALSLLRTYLDEAWASMGPSFLELVAQKINEYQAQGVNVNLGQGDGLRRMVTLPDSSRDFGRSGDVNAVDEDKHPPNKDQFLAEGLAAGKDKEETAVGRERSAIDSGNDETQGLALSNRCMGDKGTQKVKMPTKCKHVASWRRTRGRIKITEVKESGTGTSPDEYDKIPTPEFHRVKEELMTSYNELQAVVKDPLPDALRMAGSVISELAKKNVKNGHLTENLKDRDADVPSTSTNGCAEAVQHKEPNIGHQSCSGKLPIASGNDGEEPLDNETTGNQSHTHQNNASRRSLMERNSTAQTYEWDDSIDDSSGGLSFHMKNLGCPKRMAAAPLEKYEMTKISRRRKIKKWSLLEEDTLRTGVQKFGRGNWKLILNAYRDVFEERTEVDLKDKWRNMTR